MNNDKCNACSGCKAGLMCNTEAAKALVLFERRVETAAPFKRVTEDRVVRTPKRLPEVKIVPHVNPVSDGEGQAEMKRQFMDAVNKMVDDKVAQRLQNQSGWKFLNFGMIVFLLLALLVVGQGYYERYRLQALKKELNLAADDIRNFQEFTKYWRDGCDRKIADIENERRGAESNKGFFNFGYAGSKVSYETRIRILQTPVSEIKRTALKSFNNDQLEVFNNAERLMANLVKDATERELQDQERYADMNRPMFFVNEFVDVIQRMRVEVVILASFWCFRSYLITPGNAASSYVFAIGVGLYAGYCVFFLLVSLVWFKSRRLSKK